MLIQFFTVVCIKVTHLFSHTAFVFLLQLTKYLVPVSFDLFFIACFHVNWDFLLRNELILEVSVGIFAAKPEPEA